MFTPILGVRANDGEACEVANAILARMEQGDPKVPGNLEIKKIGEGENLSSGLLIVSNPNLKKKMYSLLPVVEGGVYVINFHPNLADTGQRFDSFVHEILACLRKGVVGYCKIPNLENRRVKKRLRREVKLKARKALRNPNRRHEHQYMCY
jgi:hypothetical protein